MTTLGYLVLTEGQDGAWHDDWDGVVHATRKAALGEVDLAAESGETVIAVRLVQTCGKVEGRSAGDPDALISRFPAQFYTMGTER